MECLFLFLFVDVSDLRFELWSYIFVTDKEKGLELRAPALSSVKSLPLNKAANVS